MKFTLPKPPSINHIYGYTAKGGFARSYITREGKEWFEAAGRIVSNKNRKPISSEMEIYVELHTARAQDVDNILKPILDLLQKYGVIENDRLVYRLTVEKFKAPVADEHVCVEIMGYSD